MTGIEQMIKWLEQIEDGVECNIPYNLHEPLRAMLTAVGYRKTIKFFKDIKDMEV